LTLSDGEKNMIIHKVAHFAVAAALMTVVGLSFPATAESRGQTADPVIFIQKLANQAINVLSTQNGSLKEREDQFRDLLRDDFAMDKIGRFVAGGFWRKMSEEQRKTYQTLFSEWVLKAYSARLGGYSGEQFKVIKKSTAGKRDVIVHTQIQQTAGNAFNANWRVRKLGERYKIIDIYVEGVSMAVTQRSEFDAILRKHGIDGLIGQLRDRLSRLSTAS
jgi:phospholipid transport system substrate-binding protein